MEQALASGVRSVASAPVQRRASRQWARSGPGIRFARPKNHPGERCPPGPSCGFGERGVATFASVTAAADNAPEESAAPAAPAEQSAVSAAESGSRSAPAASATKTSRTRTRTRVARPAGPASGNESTDLSAAEADATAEATEAAEPARAPAKRTPAKRTPVTRAPAAAKTTASTTGATDEAATPVTAPKRATSRTTAAKPAAAKTTRARSTTASKAAAPAGGDVTEQSEGAASAAGSESPDASASKPTRAARPARPAPPKTSATTPRAPRRPTATRPAPQARSAAAPTPAGESEVVDARADRDESPEVTSAEVAAAQEHTSTTAPVTEEPGAATAESERGVDAAAADVDVRAPEEDGIAAGPISPEPEPEPEPELERQPEPTPDPDQAPNAGPVPESDQAPEADQAPDADQTPEPEPEPSLDPAPAESDATPESAGETPPEIEAERDAEPQGAVESEPDAGGGVSDEPAPAPEPAAKARTARGKKLAATQPAPVAEPDPVVEPDVALASDDESESSWSLDPEESAVRHDAPEGTHDPDLVDDPVLRITGLTKRFGDKIAVDAIDLAVPTGSLYGIVGPNGAGKTTTLSMITGLLRPDSGDVVVNDVHVWNEPERAKRSIGVLPDSLRLFDRLTGAQMLYYAGVLRGLDRGTVVKRSADLATAFGIEDAMGRLVTDYSAGMTKKIALAAAMIHSPRILVLDEPFESVDPVSAANLVEILQRYVAGGGTVVLSSHGMDFIQRVCDRVAVIVGGRVLASGTMDEVRDGRTLEERFVELAGGRKAAEGMEWLHTFSD